MFTRNTSFKKYIDRLKERGACKEAQTWCESIDVSRKACKFGDGIESLSNEGWAIWCLTVLGTELDAKVRISFLSKITNPMAAFQLYLRSKNLSDSEDTILEEKFKGKLPNAEKELRDGIVMRAKDKETLING